jgi:hypothetical protein
MAVSRRMQRRTAAVVEALRELEQVGPAVDGWPASYVCQRAGLPFGAWWYVVTARLERDGHVATCWETATVAPRRRLYFLGALPYEPPPEPAAWWRRLLGAAAVVAILLGFTVPALATILLAPHSLVGGP